ncbi:PREDICTED: leucine-rich repeat-containing protein C10orf11 homolog [Amphimedon queenslandica]|uniref:Leucine-rich melanocyte differentiation-associated protein n=1 Tax=Amphimedon queenslandica TaxID=400682 RepID=A0A1X7VIP3_AMPQE|nr:PREDICTED: leucine-rich repeat-containing protein C10orf11 homolog [Amphimedon queenslandica]|eukprot:XP_003384257.1 PREDICTED: leucine-rich repeat-containing protein C10orf11 homolog [Amphimedon queenslandica]
MATPPPPSATKLENDGGSSSCEEFVLIEADKTNQQPNRTRGGSMASAEALFSRNLSSSSPKKRKDSGLPNGQDDTRSQPSPSIGRDTGVETTMEDVNQVAFTGEDVESIPSHLCEKFGLTAQRLDLSYNRLKSLDGLENFKVLEELVLDNNDLTDAALSLPHLPRLHTLTLNKNQIIDTESLLSTLEKQCPSLKYLSLLGNRACPHEILQSGHDDEDYQHYRYFVLHRLPKLTFLDSSFVTSEERKEAQRVGAFMRVVRPTDSIESKKKLKKSSEDVPSGFNPLPASRDVVGQHRGVYGQCKYVYYGKHSEGNRFIRNHHL